MKTTIKFLTLLLLVIFFTSCAGLLDSKLQAKVDALCPATISTSNYDTPSGEDSVLKSTSAANNNEDNEFFLSYRVGIGTEVPINDKFSFQPGLLLAGKGNKANSLGFEEKINLTYIDIPLMLNYKLGESKFSVNGGLLPSFLVNAKRKTKVNGTEDSQKVTDQFNTFDLAAIIGAGYHFDNGFGLNIGYDHGVTNINKSNDDFGSAFKAYNRVLRLGLSYKFGNNN
jgi:hypothetical protein